MTSPVDARIFQIEQRYLSARQLYNHEVDPVALSEQGRLLLIDVPWLLAQVRELQAELGERDQEGGEPLPPPVSNKTMSVNFRVREGDYAIVGLLARQLGMTKTDVWLRCLYGFANDLGRTIPQRPDVSANRIESHVEEAKAS